MPGFDKSGPLGKGAMRGRKNGICMGNDVDDLQRGPGFGGGYFGRRGGNREGGAGLGMRRRYYQQNIIDENTVNKEMKDEMSSLREKISRLEALIKKNNNSE